MLPLCIWLKRPSHLLPQRLQANQDGQRTDFVALLEVLHILQSQNCEVA